MLHRMTNYLSNQQNIESEKSVYFYTPDFYALDNFSAFTVRIWDKEFKTAEHAYQWHKFHKTNNDIAQQILDAGSPNATKKISDANKDIVSESWKKEKLDVMENILRAKLQQHEKMRKTLLATGTRDIIENSPTDIFWGIGVEGKGRNELGKIWMKLRSELV